MTKKIIEVINTKKGQMTEPKKPKVIELVNTWSKYAIWKLSQPGPPPGWDWEEERKKLRKARLKVVKKPPAD